MRDKFWMWGYTQEKTGIPVANSGCSLKSYCSLETAADYFGCPNVVFKNSLHSLERLEENLAFVEDKKSILCALPNGPQPSLEGARRIAELSARFPRIAGVVLDDFIQLSGHSTSPELVREIRQILRSANPDMEIYVVMYSDVNHLPLEPYLDYIDGIMLWRWVSTDHFWRSEFGPLLHRTKVNTGKKVFHGVYIQDYGENGPNVAPMNFELWKLQWMKILNALRSTPFLDGCVLLQNMFVGDHRFRDHAVWLKETLEWFRGTTTDRG